MHIFIIALLSLLFQTSEQAKNNGNIIGGVIECSELEHDFGQVKISSMPVSCTFILKNVSGKDTYIEQICTTCACVTVKWDRQTIHSGEHKIITVTYNDKEQLREFKKSVIIYMSEMKNPFGLRIKGKVI